MQWFPVAVPARRAADSAPRRWLAAAVLGLLAGAQAYCAPADGSGGVEAVRDELIALGKTDQEIREGLDVNAMADTVRLRKMSTLDSASTERLREIVREHGWPGKSVVGEEAARAAFLIVQHSPSTEFQKEMLELMRSAAEAGDANRADVAMLEDRILSHEGKPQIYGTQFRIADSRLIPYPIEDPARLDERRAAIGLPPMSEYVNVLRQAYGGAVEFDTARLARDTAGR
jgi:hypothetical protein